MKKTKKLSVTIGEPLVVAQGPAEEKRWGYWQFPSIRYNYKGEISVEFNVCEDSVSAYGSPSPCFRLNAGRWVSAQDAGPAGLLLPDGDRLSHHVPPSLKVSDLKLPEPVGTWVSSYGGKYSAYRAADLPPELANPRFLRYRKGADNPVEEIAEVDEPDGVRSSYDGLFPLHGGGFFTMKVAPDKSLMLAKYGHRLLYLYNDATRVRGAGPFMSVIFLRSIDSGRKWQVQGSIPYWPDLDADVRLNLLDAHPESAAYRPDLNAGPQALQRYGFTEPGFEFAGDGTTVCIMRTTDGCGIGPMYISRSKDMGKNWSKPEVFHPFGVLPQLLRLENGVLVLSYGRPGVEVRFSGDNGLTWTKPEALLPTKSDFRGNGLAVHADSCGYTSLLATGKDRCLIAYSHFRYKDGEGRERKTILTRELAVRRST